MVGDALSVLRTLPSESVQTCVTSPPYFGLRAYGTDPQVWGGDESHSHTWGDAQPAPGWVSKNGQGATSLQDHGADGKSPYLDQVHEGTKQRSGGAFCPCGAWRGELGSEPTPDLFIEHLVSIFDEVWRVLRQDGTCWVNIGDSYSGSGKGPSGHNGIGDQEGRQGFTGGRGKTSFMVQRGDDPSWSNNQQRTGPVKGIPAKNLLLMPYRFALAMQGRGWIVRSQIVWAKTSAMPESVRDRPTSAWEPVFLFSKAGRYFYDATAVRTIMTDETIRKGGYDTNGQRSYPDNRTVSAEALGVDRLTGNMQAGRSVSINPAGANIRNVWTLGPSPFAEAHFATFPPEIPRRCILAGTSQKGACPACGAPWARVVERRGSGPKFAPLAIESSGVLPDGPGTHRNMGGRYQAWSDANPPKTTGWAPSCACPPADPAPCVVLDPFGGSGTTGLVADRLGRDATLIELNPEYAEMARRTIASDAGNLFGEAVEVVEPAQLSLMEMM
jgi:DNA modification methylase